MSGARGTSGARGMSGPRGASGGKRYGHGLVLGKFYPPHASTTTTWCAPPRTSASG